jgi:hypothetical protein
MLEVCYEEIIADIESQARREPVTVNFAAL